MGSWGTFFSTRGGKEEEKRKGGGEKEEEGEEKRKGGKIEVKMELVNIKAINWEYSRGEFMPV